MCIRDRDKPGRWQASQSDDYLRAASATIFEIRSKVARAIRSRDRRLVEGETSEALRKFAAEKEVDEAIQKGFCDRLSWPDLEVWFLGLGGLPAEEGPASVTPMGTEEEIVA
eukprot:959977-Karenia_brevis.AAC.1